jgi:hypothetical protein
MDTTTTDLTALEAELAAMEAESAEQDARIDALLARPVGRSITSQLAALQALAAENAAALDAIEAEEAEIERQIEALEQAD